MRIFLINPPYLTLTSRLGTGHQIPLGLLMIGGPLLAAGHVVRMLDAECRHLSVKKILENVRRFSPDIVMTGHAGSTPAHPICIRILSEIKKAFDHTVTVYGGVYPSFNAKPILRETAGVDVIVRGEGEAVSLELVKAIDLGKSFLSVSGIAFRDKGQIITTPSPPPIDDLDRFKIGWELIENWDDYQCFGLGRAAVTQFSRGCPHCCTFCGQREFWKCWRHRDPVKVVNEIEWLYRKHDIRFISLADENPTTQKSEWKQFLHELIKRRIRVQFFVSIRTSDIGRDADILHLYKKAGIQYILLGIESVEPEVLRTIRKGSTTRKDLEACKLLKQHGICSIMAHVVGLKEENWGTFRNSLRQLVHYNGDFVNVTHVTPHNWTSFARRLEGRKIIQPNLNKWDYRHQTIAQMRLSPLGLFLAVKWLELCFHARPGRLWAILRMKDRSLRRQLLWSLLHTGLVWFAEILLLQMTKETRPKRVNRHVERFVDMFQPRPAISLSRLASIGTIFKSWLR